MSRGAKTQAARLGQPTFFKAAQKREKNGYRQNVTKKYHSQINVTATYDWASTKHVPYCSLWRRSHTPYTIHLLNTTVKYDCESYFWILSPPKVEA